LGGHAQHRHPAPGPRRPEDPRPALDGRRAGRRRHAAGLGQPPAAAGLSIYLLGGAGNTGETTRDLLVADHPSLRVVGTYSPPFGFEKDPEQFTTMRRLIAEAKPDLVFVALSFPKGERLIQEIRAARPEAWWIGVGAAFDFISGEITRAPEIMKRTGTEWMFRMMQDPKRLVRRYLWHDLPYVGVLFAGALRKGVRGR
jgi:N-acetylglucosaminyldiphosphoundecaprenol N-acetyl-beta-D-mannosaminyltransferase